MLKLMLHVDSLQHPTFVTGENTIKNHNQNMDIKKSALLSTDHMTPPAGRGYCRKYFEKKLADRVGQGQEVFETAPIEMLRMFIPRSC